MIFVINNLKYDTDKMELISEKCEFIYGCKWFGSDMQFHGKDVKLWRSSHGRWLVTYASDYGIAHGRSISESEASKMLLSYDLAKYEELFGELEEA